MCKSESNRRLLRSALPNLAPGYGDSSHDKAADRIARDMEPGFTFHVDHYTPDDDGTGTRMVVNCNATEQHAGEAASMLEAAPDLYAACEAIVAIEYSGGRGCMCGYCGNHRTKCEKGCPIRMARAALARAKGGEA